MRKIAKFLTIFTLIHLQMVLLNAQNWTAAERYSSPSASYLTSTSTALGADGSMYVVGNYQNMVCFDTLILNAPISNRNYGYLLKLDAQMQPLWAKHFPQYTYDVTLDAQGNILIAGSYWKTVNPDDSLAYVAKYNSNGQLLASFSAQGSAESWAKVVRTDAAGNCYLAGERRSGGTANFGSFSFPPTNSRECFLLKLTPDLSQVLWASYTGHSSNLDNIYDIEIDPAGFVYTSGNYSQNYFPPIIDCGCYKGDFYVEKHSTTTGASIWKKIISGGSGDDTKQFARLSPDGQSLAVTTCFKKTVVFEPGISLTANTNLDYHLSIAQMNTSNGMVQWAKKVSSSGDSFLWRTARNNDDLWLFGYFRKQTTIGQTTLNPIGYDAFLTKVSEDGTVQNAESLTGNSTDNGFGLAQRGSILAVTGATASSNISIGTFNLPGGFNSFYVARKGGLPQLPPIAGFTASFNSGCAPLVVQFSNTSYQSPTTFNWQFPGGTPGNSTLKNPVVTYNTPGTYTVTLRVNNGGGADTLVQSNLITVSNANITAAFSNNVNGLNVSFANTSTNASAYYWDFGDGQTSTEANPTHNYLNCGTYTVTLNSSNACAMASSSASVTVGIGLPSAMFSSTLNGLTVSFQNTSSNGTYLWDFGDGQSSTEADPSHTYAACGPYTVTLTCSNICGTSTATELIIAIDFPDAMFTSTVEGMQVSFVNTSSGGDSYYWDFGDGDTSTLQFPPPHTYADTGLYVVTLVVTNTCGATIFQESISILPCAFADFEVSTQGLTAFFTNFSENAAHYLWDFGDGQTSIEESPEHAYTNSGTYTVTLTASNGCGPAVFSMQVTVINVSTVDPDWLQSFRIFPNPSSGVFSVEMEGTWTDEIRFSILNSSGQVVYNELTIPKTVAYSHQIDLKNVPSGVYWLRVMNGQKYWTQRIVVAR
ncbi:MAG: PKD domain-containing protein [Saprospiraceae bacterium]